MSFEFPEIPASAPPLPRHFIYVGEGPIPWQSIMPRYLQRGMVLARPINGSAGSSCSWAAGPLRGSLPGVMYAVLGGSPLHEFLKNLQNEPTIAYEF